RRPRPADRRAARRPVDRRRGDAGGAGAARPALFRPPDDGGAVGCPRRGGARGQAGAGSPDDRQGGLKGPTFDPRGHWCTMPSAPATAPSPGITQARHLMTAGNGLMAGKRGLVMGVANDRSIAWGIAKAVAAEGAELAFTYPNESMAKRVKPLAEQLGSSIVLECDVASDASIDAAFV